MTDTQLILQAYDRATDRQKRDGAAWYENATLWCKVKAAEYGVSLDVVAGVVAALSPRMPWARNLKVADDMLAGRPVACLLTSVGKAQEILDGARPDSVLRTSAGHKAKTWHFWCALTGMTNAVVLDSIIARLWGGDRNMFQSHVVYGAKAAAVAAAAVRRNVTNVAMQATVWLVLRAEDSRRAAQAGDALAHVAGA